MGMRNTPRDAAEATASPTMEPMSREAPMATMAIAPLKLPNQALTNLTRDSSSPPLSMSCPVRTKKGTARKLKLFMPPYIFMAS